ncbi:glycine betaine ABC transporter substrate-binding protein [Microbacterium sp. CIAB417]|uniref:glycine betaine ABC transporter substrate-binding protein n=1 Tax=Microbacterium sp. CIAB417 TaxID=2860287 RepID=UPI001FAD39A8|nr:glycine betaine ABC transporter substrate-binding protein [Microbacterium sp. CIAB417]
MTKRTHITAGILVLGMGATLALTGCTNDSAGASGDSDKGTITIGFLPSWTDAVNNAYLLEDQLTKLGYDVELETLTEPGMLYTALAQGDVDIYPSAWPEISQKAFMEKYGDDLEDLGTYYEGAQGFLAVPDYVDDIDSVEDLKGQADRFDGRIYTIEPGSGTATMAAEKLFPAHQLGDEYSLTSSSLAAMLTVVDDAVQSQEDVVVTLWKPFWAIDAYGLKELDDPLNGMGDPEGLHFLGHKGFSEEFPEAAELIGQITLDDAQYGSLENLVVNEFGSGQEPEAVDAWLEENGDQLDWAVTE